MRARLGEGRPKHWRLIGAVCALLAAALIVTLAWQAAGAQTPPSGVQLEWVNEDEDWIERKKHGEFRARPIFSAGLTTLYYGIRDADTGEWLT
ncbi:MAG: hypothetical protein OXH38_10320, partial [Chloroflexi bacterium]|nr:hypothetical protein [Chloroflexota bacterium]